MRLTGLARQRSLIMCNRMEVFMKTVWQKPTVTEQEVGLEVTSYSPAELDRP